MVPWNHAGFSATAGCNFHGKTRINKMHWTKKFEKLSSLLTKTEIENKSQTVEDPKTEKPNQTLAKSAKPKFPAPRSLSRIGNIGRIGWAVYMYSYICMPWLTQFWRLTILFDAFSFFLQELLSYVSKHAKMNVTLDNLHGIYDTLFCEVHVLDDFFCLVL